MVDEQIKNVKRGPISKITINLILCALFALSLFMQSAFGFAIIYSEVTPVSGTYKNSTLAETSIAISSDKKPHIVYYNPGKSELRYTKNSCDGPSIIAKKPCYWSRAEFVSSTLDVQAFNSHTPSLALDSKGNPHIAYIDDNFEQVKYVTKKNGVWTPPKIVDSAGKFSNSVIQLDSLDIPHIVYVMNVYKASNKERLYFSSLKYATSEGSSWKKESIYDAKDLPPERSVVRHPSFVYDSTNIPHVAYSLGGPDLDHPGPTVEYATNTFGKKLPLGYNESPSEPGYEVYWVADNDPNTRWANEGVGSWIVLNTAHHSKICSVNIAWYEGNHRHYNFVISASPDATTYTDILTTKSSGTTVKPERYVVTPTNAEYLKITVNGNDVNDWASITGVSITGTDNGYPCEWYRETVAGGPTLHPSIGVDSNDFPHISYTERENYHLNYVSKDSHQLWKDTIVDSFSPTGLESYLAMDKAHNYPNFVYLTWWESAGDPLIMDLKIARQNVNTPIEFDEGLSLENDKYLSYPSPELSGSHSIAVDSAGAMHISYIVGNNKLKYAYVMGPYGS